MIFKVKYNTAVTFSSTKLIVMLESVDKLFPEIDDSADKGSELDFTDLGF